jgi:cytidylate kinase
MGSKESFDLIYNKLSDRNKINFCLEFLKSVPKKKVLVDGLAGSGKGILLEKMVEGLKLKKFSSGDVYRIITWYFLKIGVTKDNIEEFNDEQLERKLSGLEIDFDSLDSGWWLIDPKTNRKLNIVGELRSQAVDSNISSIVGRDPVRDIVDKHQRKIVEKNDNVFLEGRDMWDIFKNVEGVLLAYLYASDEELIRREIGRQNNLGNTIDQKEAQKRVINRNVADSNRERGRLLLPEEAEAGMGEYHLVVDTTELKPDEVYLLVLEMLYAELIK